MIVHDGRNGDVEHRESGDVGQRARQERRAAAPAQVVLGQGQLAAAALHTGGGRAAAGAIRAKRGFCRAKGEDGD